MALSLTPSQKTICERIINVFETGSARGDYSCISIYKDGPGDMRQITFGRSQTTEYGNLAELVQMYAEAGGKYSSDLAPYAPRIGKNPLVDNSEFKALLVRAAREDPIMCATQDAFFDKRYFLPAQKWAEEHGFTYALSMLVIYDSFVHSGGILPFLQNSFPERVPSAGGDERVWISKYVQARQHWLATSARTVLHSTVYRTECFQAEINRGNWDLRQIPIFAHGVRVDDKPFSLEAKPILSQQTLPSSPTPVPQPLKPLTTEPAMTAAATTVTPAPAAPASGGGIGSFLVSLLNSTQLQSFGRTFAKVGGALLVAKYGIDPSSLASIVGGFMALGGVLSSVKAHANANTPIAIPPIPISEVVGAAVQSAANAAVTAVLASVTQPLTAGANNANPLPAVGEAQPAA